MLYSNKSLIARLGYDLDWNAFDSLIFAKTSRQSWASPQISPQVSPQVHKSAIAD